MTGRDPDLQREIDRAITWWADHLRPRLLPGLDPEDLARRGVEAMYAENWRPVPRPAPLQTNARRDQGAYERGAGLARKGLADIGLLPEGPAE